MGFGSIVSKVKMGGSEQQVTRVLFCGQQFTASYLYTKEYLSKYPHIQVDDVALSDVPNVVGNYHLCIPRMMRLDSDVISRAEQMKLILQFGVGLEGVDVVQPQNMESKLLEFQLMELGMLPHKEMEMSIKLKKLGEPAGGTLFGKTVFIMGFGNIGRELAKRLKPFDVKIIATKRNWNSLRLNGFPAQMIVMLIMLMKRVVMMIFTSMQACRRCLLLLEYESRDSKAGVVNHKFIQSMKKGAYLINVARGGLLDYDAVAQSLKSGHLEAWVLM
ncbi:Hydroxypyruvate reductase [Bienertia sinuspersici]